MTAAKQHHKDPRLDALHDRRKKLGTQKHDLLSKVQRVDRRIATVQKRVKGVHKDRDHLRHSYDPMGFDGCPVSPVVFVVLTAARKSPKVHAFGVISADRRDGVAQRFGHSSQDELYIDWQKGLPGYLPANPSNSSTHEYVNGGNGGTPAYPSVQFAVGTHLPPWALGLDLRSNAEATQFCHDVKAALGIEFWQPYPTTSEAHHVDMRHDPLPQLVKLGLA